MGGKVLECDKVRELDRWMSSFGLKKVIFFIGGWWLAVGWLLVGWLLVAGCWLLVAGWWLLVVLVAGCWLVVGWLLVAVGKGSKFKKRVQKAGLFN